MFQSPLSVCSVSALCSHVLDIVFILNMFVLFYVPNRVVCFAPGGNRLNQITHETDPVALHSEVFPGQNGYNNKRYILIAMTT